MGRLTMRRSVVRISPSGVVRRPDALAVEEPMELRVDGRALAVTMRMPGADGELAHGFLLIEGVITATAGVLAARYCTSADAAGRNTYNMFDIVLARHVLVPATDVKHNFYSTSSCGVCGKCSLEAVRMRTAFSPNGNQVMVSPETLAALPGCLRAAQQVFGTTRGLPVAGLFAADGSLPAGREDVGRHDAVDKVLGRAVFDGRVPATGCVLTVSGRTPNASVPAIDRPNSSPAQADAEPAIICRPLARPNAPLDHYGDLVVDQIIVNLL